MRGHIVKRSKNKGTWSIVIELDRDSTTGKRRQKWFTLQGSHKDAKKKLTELLHQLDTGSYIEPSKTTMAEYLEYWLAEYVKPNLSPKGYERYESISRVHLIPAIGNIALTQLKPEHLQKLYAAKIKAGLQPRTVRYHHVVLHKAIAIAMKWGMGTRNVADSVDIPRSSEADMQTWNENELAQFLEASKDSQYYELYYLALFTGMRRSELLALRWCDIDFVYSQIYVNRGLHHLKDGSYVFTQPKSARSRRTIALSPSAISVLRQYYDKRQMDAAMLGISLTDNDLVFSTVEGKPLRPNTVTRAWKNMANRAGIKVIRLHDARHTHASLMLKQGIHPKIVQERLGHASIQITLDTYSHVAPGLQEAAAKSFDALVKIPVSKRLAKLAT
ncbi:MAG TPA: site-specific integrase [Dehalococcoidia bacterium]|nr:site-specific integrase [Dehalococcoidia bacterium]